MMYKLCVYFLMFLIFSLGGWIIETLLYIIRDKKLVKRGFLFGPMCPIYGVGAVICSLVLYRRVTNPALIFLYGLLLCGTLEYITHFCMEKLFHAVWWDYSNRRFNINGRVYLKGLIFFGAGAVLMVMLLIPNVFWLIYLMPKNAVYIVSLVAYSLLLIDISTTLAALTSSIKSLRRLTELGIEKGQHGIDVLVEKGEDTRLNIRESRLVQDLIENVNNEHSVISRIKRKYPNFHLKDYKYILDIILDKPMEDKGRKDIKVFGTSDGAGAEETGAEGEEPDENAPEEEIK